MPADATAHTIRKAYRKLARELHPDKNLDNKEESQEKFIKVVTAFETLSDEEVRQSYDYALAHPEETIRNRFRYYRARYQPRIPLSWVIAGTTVVGLVIECTVLHTTTERHKRKFRKASDTVRVSRLQVVGVRHSCLVNTCSHVMTLEGGSTSDTISRQK